MGGTTKGEKEAQEPAAAGQVERIPLCEICADPDQVELTADPDHGGLQLCAGCRRLFGFDQ